MKAHGTSAARRRRNVVLARAATRSCCLGTRGWRELCSNIFGHMMLSTMCTQCAAGALASRTLASGTPMRWASVCSEGMWLCVYLQCPWNEMVFCFSNLLLAESSVDKLDRAQPTSWSQQTLRGNGRMVSSEASHRRPPQLLVRVTGLADRRHIHHHSTLPPRTACQY